MPTFSEADHDWLAANNRPVAPQQLARLLGLTLDDLAELAPGGGLQISET